MARYCSECGVTLNEEDLFCVNCGANLEELEKEEPVTDEDIRVVLSTLNDLLDNLPDKVINNFAKTKEFSTYEKVMRKYKIK